MDTIRGTRPSLVHRFQSVLLACTGWPMDLLSRRYHSFMWGVSRLSPRYMEWAGRIRARNAYYRAVREVPAYAEFIAGQAAGNGSVREMDKEGYIKAFPVESRCVGGRIPATLTMIDESSGSTGTPYNWVRSPKERRQSHVFVSYFATYCFGSEPGIIINAFSMGAWATGLNMGISLQRIGIVKNTGPDIPKIFNTLQFFGAQYRYLITGYPPFLKHLMDTAEAEGFPLRDFRLNALVGGEGMSEGLRDYLQQSFEHVYSGYGATDLEIGIAGETPTSVAIRRLARERSDAREKLFGSDPRLPMVFQYNPQMHHIEVNARGELLFTITRGSLLSPRIRYNVHDTGGCARYDTMRVRLAELGFDIETLASPAPVRRLRLPFLWIYGRSDYTVSVMGANIYPEDLEQSLYAEPDLARITRSFCLALSEPSPGNVRPSFLFEIESDPTEELKDRFARSMLERLRAVNGDFREAYNEYPEAMVPEVELYRVGDGPFASDKEKIKQTRLIRKA